MQGTSRSDLAVELDRCARLLEDTAERHVDHGGELLSALLLAAAAMDTAAGVVDEHGRTRETALLITATLTLDAVGAIERHGLDESLLHCLATLRRVSAQCEAAIGN
jgi:hypothetical protein